MDKVVHKPLPPKERRRLKLLQEELEGQELTVLLERLQKQFDLSVNQMAIAAGMDESAMHKILKGENREFKAKHVDALLDELERRGKLTNVNERAIWQRALRIAAFLHFAIYKAFEQRLRQIEDIGKRIEALKSLLREQYPSLAETYDKSGGTLPIFVPLFDIVGRELHKRWGWIRIPPGYDLNRIEGNRYYMVSTDLFPKKITTLGPDLEIEDTGLGTFTVHRRLPSQASISQSRPSRSNFKQMGGIEFVRVPAGKFLMGSRHNNKLAYDWEKPQNSVVLPSDYWIGRFPITNEQFATFVEATNHKHSWVRDWKKKLNHPVINISWNDAQAYCHWLNETRGTELPKGFVFRLPTEAEWEKAARGEFGFEWPWGNEFDKNKCNTADGVKGGTTPVGAYSPAGDSPYGAADMVGNVWEWTQSLSKGYPYQAKDGREDLMATGARVVRGGSWGDSHHGARCASRGRGGPGDLHLGFRVVCSPSLLDLDFVSPLPKSVGVTLPPKED